MNSFTARFDETNAFRVLAYCHDSVGIGHVRRTLAICDRVGSINPSCSFLLATGTPYVHMLNQYAHVDCIKLPALTKMPGGGYQSKYLGLSIEDMMACRRSLLLETCKSFSPHMMLVDKAPLGVCRELVPTLRWVKANRPEIPVVFGMRDIEDDDEATIRQWERDGVAEIIESCYDEVWVYGTRDVFDVGVRYRLSAAIRRKLRYMGYIARPVCAHVQKNSPRAADRKVSGLRVLVTVGGGTDGEQILDAYLGKSASIVAALGGTSIIVGGPDLPAAAARRLREAAAKIAGVEWRDFEACMSCRIQEADLVVCMGGYNTLCEIASHGKPAVVVPRVHPRLEQKIRADLWKELGIVAAVAETPVNAAALGDQVLAALSAGPRRFEHTLDLKGLDQVAGRFRALWSMEHSDATAVRV